MRLRNVVMVVAGSCAQLTALGQSAGDSDVRRALAQSIASARESAGGRQWDAAFRASFVSRLSEVGFEALARLAQDGEAADLGPYIGYGVRPAASQGATPAPGLGDSTKDLVFTPIAPCRVINSVAAPGPIVVPPGGSTTKEYVIRG